MKRIKSLYFVFALHRLNIDDGLTDAEKAQMLFVKRTLEEHLYWIMVHDKSFHFFDVFRFSHFFHFFPVGLLIGMSLLKLFSVNPGSFTTSLLL